MRAANTRGVDWSYLLKLFAAITSPATCSQGGCMSGVGVRCSGLQWCGALRACLCVSKPHQINDVSARGVPQDEAIQRVLGALPAAHLRPLRLLERLVRAEEMRDLPQHVFGNVTQRVHFGVVRIFCAAYRVHMRLSGSATETALVRHVRYLPDSEHLLVHALLILHDHVSTAQMGIFLTNNSEGNTIYIPLAIPNIERVNNK